ncbi:2969_t:CDS:2 [Gigaspora rosea]|nr:2969_t:CDS:2 [Gigaspora rosea]
MFYSIYNKNTHIPSEINHAITHKTEDLIIYENLLNSDQTENLVICMQENNEKINIVLKNDEINVDNSTLGKHSKSDNINELHNRFGSRSYDENIIENESIQIKREESYRYTFLSKH